MILRLDNQQKLLVREKGEGVNYGRPFFRCKKNPKSRGHFFIPINYNHRMEGEF